MANYPDKKLVVDVLLEAAEKAAYDNDAQHPEDIVASMVAHLDGAATAIMSMHRRQNTIITADRISVGTAATAPDQDLHIHHPLIGDEI